MLQHLAVKQSFVVFTAAWLLSFKDKTDILSLKVDKFLFLLDMLHTANQLSL